MTKDIVILNYYLLEMNYCKSFLQDENTIRTLTTLTLMHANILIADLSFSKSLQ